MAEELTAIDRYRAQWEPNEARVLQLRAALKKAQENGDLGAQVIFHSQLLSELLPPRHLPIKNLEKIDYGTS